MVKIGKTYLTWFFKTPNKNFFPQVSRKKIPQTSVMFGHLFLLGSRNPSKHLTELPSIYKGCQSAIKRVHLFGDGLMFS